MPRLTMRERIFGRVEDRALPAAENELPLLGTYAGTTITPHAALAIADVWSCVRLLSATASSLPLHVFRKGEQGRQRIDSGFLVELLERPGPGMTQADLVSTLMVHLLTWGNAYIGKFRRGGEIVQLATIHPERIRPEIQDGELRFRYSPPTGAQQMLTESDVVYIKGLSVDGLIGLSAVSQAARVLNLSDELVKHAVSFFDTGTPTPAGVLKLGEGASFADEERHKEAMKAEARHGGILVVQGDADFSEMRAKLDDSQFTEQRRLSVQEVCRCFGVPSHLLNAGTGGDSLTYSTSESMSADFLKFSLAPWLRKIELALSGDRDLTSQRQYTKFSVDSLLRATARDRAEIYQLGLVGGWLDVDEVRAWEDLPPRAAPTAPATLEQMLANGNPTTPAEVGSND